LIEDMQNAKFIALHSFRLSAILLVIFYYSGDLLAQSQGSDIYVSVKQVTPDNKEPCFVDEPTAKSKQSELRANMAQNTLIQQIKVKDQELKNLEEGKSEPERTLLVTSKTNEPKTAEELRKEKSNLERQLKKLLKENAKSVENK